MQRIVVLLPDPFGPRKPVTRPGWTSKLRSSTATVFPNRFVRLRTSIMATIRAFMSAFSAHVRAHER